MRLLGKFFLAVAGIFLLAQEAFADDAEHPAVARVAVFSLDGDRDLEALISVAVSKVLGVDAVERVELDNVLNEQALQAVLRAEGGEVSLGRLVQADYFLSIQQDADREIRWQIVHCGSGRLLGSGLVSKEELSGKISAEIALLRKEERTAGRQGTIVVEDFQTADVAQNFRLAAEMRQELHQAGFHVLDRSLVEHAVAEQGLISRGMVAGDSVAELLRADFLLRGKQDGEMMVLTLLNAKTGRVAATKAFEMRETALAGARWLISQMKEVPAAGLGILDPQVQVEALVQLYQGIQKFREGDLRAAVLAFWQAQDLDDKFQEALEWEARCYDALDLPELARAVRRYSRECLVGRGFSAPSYHVPAEGITFFGIQGANPLRNMAAIDVLLDLVAERLVLPEHIAALRSEYDSLVGGNEAAWSASPNFLTRWSLTAFPLAAGGLEWTLFDTLSGSIVGSAQTSSQPEKDWGRELSGMLKRDGTEGEVLKEVTFTERDAEILPAGTFETGREIIMNLGLLELLIGDPRTSQLRGRKFQKTSNRKWNGLEGFLNFGLRDCLIRKLDPNDPYVAWLKLSRIAQFLPRFATGFHYSGETVDARQELREFIAGNQGAVRAFARYLLLWESLGELTYEEIGAACREIYVELEGNTDSKQVQVGAIAGMARNLEILAKVAAGESVYEMPGKPYPSSVIPEFRPGGEIRASAESGWFCNEWAYLDVPKSLWREEAEASFEILGRGDNLHRMDFSWVERYPNSLTVLIYAIRAQELFGSDRGRPFAYPDDSQKQRAGYRKLLAHCREKLPFWAERCRNAEELNFVNRSAGRLVKSLVIYPFMNEVSDEEFETIQQEMALMIRNAALRLGLQPSAQMQRWMHMPRRTDLEVWNAWYTNRADALEWQTLLAREAKAARESFYENPHNIYAWWSLMRSKPLRHLRSQKRAELALKHLQKVWELVEEDLDFNGWQYQQFLFDYAVMLFDGGFYSHAEPLFRVAAGLMKIPYKGMSGGLKERENAKLYLAFCLYRQGFPEEALPLAQECVQIDEQGIENIPLVTVIEVDENKRSYSYKNEGYLQTIALRLIRDIRLEASLGELPKNLEVSYEFVPGNHGLKVPFFLRIPPKIQSPTILVLLPSLNHGALEYIRDSSKWARFADENGMVLLVPEFYMHPGDLDDRYHNPQDWSGEVLLRVVDRVRARFPEIRSEKILLHGYGAGGQFAQRFARWAPERCLAISAHSPGSAVWHDGIPGLKPFSALSNVPMFLSCGENDNFSFDEANRLAVGRQFAAEARAAGVPVIWEEWKDTGHQPTRELEDAAKAFLLSRSNL